MIRCFVFVNDKMKHISRYIERFVKENGTIEANLFLFISAKVAIAAMAVNATPNITQT
jgi:hypothetical protein